MSERNEGKKRMALRILRETRALLNRPGVWVKGTYATHGPSPENPKETIGQFCLVGGLEHTTGLIAETFNEKAARAKKEETADKYLDLVKEAWDAKWFARGLVWEEVGKVYTRDYLRIEEFNDRDETTKKDVLSVLDKAILKLKKEVQA